MASAIWFELMVFRLSLVLSTLFIYWSVILPCVCLVIFHRLGFNALFQCELCIVIISSLLDGVVGGYGSSTQFDMGGFCLGLLHLHVLPVSWRSWQEGKRCRSLLFHALVQSAIADGPQAVLCAFADLEGRAGALARSTVLLHAVRLNGVTCVLGGAMALVTFERQLLQGRSANSASIVAGGAGSVNHSSCHAFAAITHGCSACAHTLGSYWGLLFAFRASELASRVCSVALFAWTTRSVHGAALLLFADACIMAALLRKTHAQCGNTRRGSTARHSRLTNAVNLGSHLVLLSVLFITNPSGFTEYEPRVPAIPYYALRLAELLTLSIATNIFISSRASPALQQRVEVTESASAGVANATASMFPPTELDNHAAHDHKIFVRVALISTCMAVALFPFVLRAAAKHREYRVIHEHDPGVPEPSDIAGAGGFDDLKEEGDIVDVDETIPGARTDTDSSSVKQNGSMLADLAGRIFVYQDQDYL